jgi:hypothetical protein
VAHAGKRLGRGRQPRLLGHLSKSRLQLRRERRHRGRLWRPRISTRRPERRWIARKQHPDAPASVAYITSDDRLPLRFAPAFSPAGTAPGRPPHSTTT